MSQAEFDRYADEYELMHARNIAITGESPEYFHRYKIESIARYLHDHGLPAQSILDFGSGIGNSIPHFRKTFPQAALTCADISPRSLALAKLRFPGRERQMLIEADLGALEPDTFDVAFSSCVFHHIDHDLHAFWLAQILQRVRPGGVLFIFEHNPLNVLTRHAVNTCPFDVEAKLIRAGKLALTLAQAGWIDIDVRYTVFFPKVLAALRGLERHLGHLPLGAQYRLAAFKPGR